MYTHLHIVTNIVLISLTVLLLLLLRTLDALFKPKDYNIDNLITYRKLEFLSSELYLIGSKLFVSSHFLARRIENYRTSFGRV